jgi:hypothetical protein
MRLHDEIRSASEVRNRWADTLNEVARGIPVTVPRSQGHSVTLVPRDSLVDLMRQHAQLQELMQVCQALHDPQTLKGVREAETAIKRGEWHSFEDVFDEPLDESL